MLEAMDSLRDGLLSAAPSGNCVKKNGSLPACWIVLMALALATVGAGRWDPQQHPAPPLPPPGDPPPMHDATTRNSHKTKAAGKELTAEKMPEEAEKLPAGVKAYQTTSLAGFEICTNIIIHMYAHIHTTNFLI